MIKLIIDNKNKERFQKMFRFFSENHCELCLFQEGLKWRNENCNGIVYSGAFRDYPIRNKRKIGFVKNSKVLLKQFFDNWKDNKSLDLTCIEIK